MISKQTVVPRRNLLQHVIILHLDASEVVHMYNCMAVFALYQAKLAITSVCCLTHYMLTICDQHPSKVLMARRGNQQAHTLGWVNEVSDYKDTVSVNSMYWISIKHVVVYKKRKMYVHLKHACIP